jgi:hypothetical protein
MANFVLADVDCYLHQSNCARAIKLTGLSAKRQHCNQNILLSERFCYLDGFLQSVVLAVAYGFQ